MSESEKDLECKLAFLAGGLMGLSHVETDDLELHRKIKNLEIIARKMIYKISDYGLDPTLDIEV